MTNSYKQLSKLAPAEAECSDRVCTKVMGMIESAETRRCRRQACLHITLVVGAVLVFIPAIGFWRQDIANSGFFQYLSLLVSDSSYVASHGKDFVLSVADSLPVSAGIIMLALVVILANSLRRASLYLVSWGTHRERLRHQFA
jgi:hypothetical protein